MHGDRRTHRSAGARHEALTFSLERIGRGLEAICANSEKDGEKIRALARIAEVHAHRRTGLEGGPTA